MERRGSDRWGETFGDMENDATDDEQTTVMENT